jgi:hypothetical protein
MSIKLLIDRDHTRGWASRRRLSEPAHLLNRRTQLGMFGPLYRGPERSSRRPDLVVCR